MTHHFISCLLAVVCLKLRSACVCLELDTDDITKNRRRILLDLELKISQNDLPATHSLFHSLFELFRSYQYWLKNFEPQRKSHLWREREVEQSYLFHSPYITKSATFSSFLMHVLAVTLILNFKWYNNTSIRQVNLELNLQLIQFCQGHFSYLRAT